MRNIYFASFVVILVVAVLAIMLAYQFGVKPQVIATGSIRLAPEIAADPNGYQAMFITVFDQSAPGPMPYGAMRQKVNSLPMHFTVTKERLQIMRPDDPLPQTIRVKARLDVDGQGGMDQPGDVVGELTNLPLGTQNLELVLSKKIKQ